MTKIILLLIAVSPAVLFAGIIGSGVGPRPIPEIGAMSLRNDFVKSLGSKNGVLVFAYKAYDSQKVETHAEMSEDLELKYLEAIQRSEETRKWEKVDQ